MTRVLVLAPHPDDECLGCGGTLARHANDGDAIDIVYLTSGEKVDPEHVREEEAARVCSLLRATPHFWREPDGGLTIHERLTTKIRQLVIDLQPDIVYAPHKEERHADHAAAYAIAWWGTRGLPNDQHPRLRLYEVWSPLPEIRDRVVITSFRAVKLKLCFLYQSQFNGTFDNRMPQALLSLNEYRGITLGMPYDLMEVYG